MSRNQTAILLKEFSPSEPQKAFDIAPNVPVPEPKEGELLVRLTCRPINPADTLCLQGLYPRISRDLPTVPGIEGVGYVESAGPNAGRKFSKGARVVGTPFPLSQKMGGTWQQYVTVKEDDLVAAPKELDDEVACQIYINPMTVRGFFDALDIPKGEYLLQSAAGSVLGRVVIQMAKHFGVRTINVVRREEQKEELLELGGDEVIVSTGDSGEDIVQRVKTITDDKGAYATVDAVGGELTGKLLAATRNSGTLLVYGALSGLTFTAGIPDVLFQSKTVKGFNLTLWKNTLARERVHELLDEVIDLLVKQKLTPFSGKSFPLESAAEAVVEAGKAARGGKVFLTG